jgi:hypothetical protein
MTSTKRRTTAPNLAIIIAWLTACPLAIASEKVTSKDIVLTGTVGSIFQVDAPPPSIENWGVYLNVEKVKKGAYSEPTFTFTVHSPVRMGLWVGCRYTIEATWNGQRYEVRMSGIKVEVCNR